MLRAESDAQRMLTSWIDSYRDVMSPKQKKEKGGHTNGIASNFETSKNQMNACLDALVHTPHQERVDIAKPLWEKMSAKAREEELAVSVSQARIAARAIAEQARKVSSNAIKGGWEVDPWTQEQLKAEATLEDALQRLESHGTWKRWTCHICQGGSGTFFYDAETFRSHMSTQHLTQERRSLMPEADSTASHAPTSLDSSFHLMHAPTHFIQAFESPLEEGLRRRMGDLLECITQEHQKLCAECGMPMSAASCGINAPMGPGQEFPLATDHSPASSSSQTNNGAAAAAAASSGREEGAGSKHKGQKNPSTSSTGSKGSNRRTVASSSYDYYYDQDPMMSPENIRKVRVFELQTIRRILAALSLEHPFYSLMILKPLLHFLNIKETSASPYSLLEKHLERLDCDWIGRCCEWLTEKIDSLCMQIKPDEKSDDPEGRHLIIPNTSYVSGHISHLEDMSDIDLWTLTEKSLHGQPPVPTLVVNDKWLAHLSGRLLGDDGHPRKSDAVEDPTRTGLILEWIYGCIVSTAEKARDSAHRCLDLAPPYTDQAWSCLIAMLDQQQRCLELLEIVKAAAGRERSRLAVGDKEEDALANDEEASYEKTLLEMSGELMIGPYLSLPRLSGLAGSGEKEPRLSRLERTLRAFVAEGEVAIGHCEMVLINVACDDPGAILGIQVILPLLQQRIDMRIALYQMESADRVVAQLIKEEEAEKMKAKVASEEKSKAKKKDLAAKKKKTSKAPSSGEDEPKKGGVEAKQETPASASSLPPLVEKGQIDGASRSSSGGGGGKEHLAEVSSSKCFQLDGGSANDDDGWIEVDNTQKPKAKIPSVRSMTDASKVAHVPAATPPAAPRKPMPKPPVPPPPAPSTSHARLSNGTVERSALATLPPPPSTDKQLHVGQGSAAHATTSPFRDSTTSPLIPLQTPQLPHSLDYHLEADRGLHMRLSDVPGESSGAHLHFSLPSSLLDDLGPRWGEPATSSAAPSMMAAPPGPPALLCCPITGSLMEDPVVASDGFFYEREAIIQWMQSGRQVSPVTSTPLTSRELITAWPLRKAIVEYRDGFRTH